MTWRAKFATTDWPCSCWDCLRARGITPDRSSAYKHPGKYPALVYRTDNGQPVTTSSHREAA